MDWRESAACSTTNDPDLWFSMKPAEQAKAKAVCDVCPVKVQCEAYGADTPFGIFGGVTAAARGFNRYGQPAVPGWVTQEEREERNKAIMAMRNDGWRVAEIAAFFGLSVTGVYSVLCRDRSGPGDTAADGALSVA